MWSVLDVVDKVEKNIEVQHTESTRDATTHVTLTFFTIKHLIKASKICSEVKHVILRPELLL